MNSSAKLQQQQQQQPQPTVLLYVDEVCSIGKINNQEHLLLNPFRYRISFCFSIVLCMVLKVNVHVHRIRLMEMV